MKKPSVPTVVVPAAEAGLPASLRSYLYLTSALTGAAILIVEILGARMLTPYFGLSHFVWTAQITMTLVALAAGYYLGGRLADRSPNLDRMYTAILVAAVYLCVSVWLCAPVSFACLKMRLALGSLLASLFLFFVPLTLLAIVVPFLVRNFTQQISSVGGQVGRLSAVSTLGSVAGTVLIGYVLILLPNSMTMYLTAVGLMAIATGYFFLVQKRSLGRQTIMLVMFNLLVGLSAGYAGVRADLKLDIADCVELERRNSNFGQLLVIERKSKFLRYYLNDYLTQNTYDPRLHKSTSMFTYMLHGLARSYTPKIERALCIGLGVGIVPMELAKDGVRVDVVEINSAVVGVAQRHFNFKPDKVNVIIDDGRHYLNECHARYDTIILDAFLGDSSPGHLMTKEAFTAMRKVLKPGGTLVINSFGDLNRSRNFFSASLERTLQAVFKSVRMHTAPIHQPDGLIHFGGNLLYVASDTPNLKFVHEPDFSEVHPGALDSTRDAFANVVSTPPQDGRVLTDDFNPVEYYDAANRETIRKNLNEYWRNPKKKVAEDEW